MKNASFKQVKKLYIGPITDTFLYIYGNTLIHI